MKPIKVYLQYPWKFPDSPYYKYLIDNPPENIEYLNVKKQKGVITSKKFFWFSNFLKRNIRRFVNFFGLSFPNAHLTRTKENFDLIHCAHCLSLNKNRPWVADFESEWQFYIGKKTKRAKEKVKKILMSNNCKRILAWTEKTKEEILKEFPEIGDKVGVVYPAVPVNKRTSKKNKNDKITILYATRYFWFKGGIIALEVYKKLQEKYKDKIELIFISDVPEKVKEGYPKLKIRNLVSNKELFKLYEKSDIFFYPSFVDTFGFGLLEAMGFGLPTITINTKHTLTRKEIIEDNKHGFVFDISDEITEKLIKKKERLTIMDKEKEIINKLFENCSKLIKNKKLREKMSKRCTEIIKNGKFSIKERNKKLEKIYDEAIK